jgi:rhamnosyl/mannosyltransferase
MYEGVKLTRFATPLTISNGPVSPGLVRKLRETSWDVVHIHHPNPFAMLAYFASGCRSRLVITYHSDILRQKYWLKLVGPVVNLALQRSSAVIVATQQYLDSSPLLTRYRERCQIVPYAVEGEQFTEPPAAEVEAIRRQYGDRLITAVGRMVYYKGLEHLVVAMAKVPGRLLLIGTGPLRGHLEATVRALQLEDRVVFLGDVDNVGPYYRASEVFVLPSILRSESFGIVQLEAMAAGTPVINTSIDSGVPHVSLDGITGLTVAPGDPDALAGALNHLLEDPALRHRLGQAGRQRALSLFHPQHVAEKTTQIYQAVVQDAREGVDSKSRMPAHMGPVNS